MNDTDMPDCNGKKYLEGDISGILNQIFTDFVFIILDDGSTNILEKTIISYTDPGRTIFL